jgi:Fe-S cluster assembly scaffold protein SufB
MAASGEPESIYKCFHQEGVALTVENATETDRQGIIYRYHLANSGHLEAEFRPPQNYSLEVILHLETEAKAEIRIFYHGTNHSTFTCRTLQCHLGNGGASKVELRSIGEDEARIDYVGKIEIPERVVAVKAEQRSKSLVFSEAVRIHVEPAMDVHSRDVECIHGATIGGIDSEILHYFSVRGIETPLAKELYIAGFLN